MKKNNKHICEDERIKDKIQEHDKVKKILSDLTEDILKAFDHFPSKNTENNIKKIGSNLIKITKDVGL